MEYLHEYVKPFFYEGKDEGCLIIHGFTGSPAHMRPLGEILRKQGYTVSGILLKGHGTSLEDMEKTDWQDWLQSAREGYEQLRKKCSKVYVMGLSMGGTLSLLLAEHFPVDKVISIAAPVRVFDKLLPYASVLKYFRRFITWEDSPAVEGEKKEYDIGYKGVPVRCAPSLWKLMKMVERDLPRITCPALIVQSRMDKTVKPESAQMIYDGISSTRKEILWLECSKHVCTLGPEREIMHEKILSFLAE